MPMRARIQKAIETGERTMVLGVDPGYSGALALYDLETRKLIYIKDMPITTVTMASGKSQRRLDTTELAIWLDMHRHLVLGCVIEEVTAAPGQGVVSMFNFGFSTGVLHGEIAAQMIPIFSVRPTVWKANLGLTSNKDLSRQKAQLDFPEMHTEFLLKKHDGRAEAALLAKYGERIFGISKEKRLL